ncbi:MAG: hypothetical protein B1H11_01470 [Desulfobacteraceae bacterium 4484_190.1]|nr:MAG: hypothetical protein B1H11_01470 [Desulfobacteraceae bacterium 4484_190.1]
MIKILSADIGGTNSRFAYFRYDENKKLGLIETVWLKSGEAVSFADLISKLKKSDFSLALEEAGMAVFAVAGPVEQGCYSAPPYIPWDIDISNANKDFGLRRCTLINDFVAQAYACRSPMIESAQDVVPGKIDPNAPLIVTGAGTALGISALVPLISGGYIAIPSEGGHASFPFESEPEFKYMKFLLKELGTTYITANTVVSGKGLSLLHQFFTGEKLEPAEVTKCLNEESEVLINMARFYGRICRNFALQFLAMGGVYISGGVAAKLPELVTHKEFAKEFHRSETKSTDNSIN